MGGNYISHNNVGITFFVKIFGVGGGVRAGSPT